MDALLPATTPDLFRLDDLLHLYDLDAYVTWAAMELEGKRQEAAAAKAMHDTERYLDSLVDAAMDDDLHRSFDEMERLAEEELSKLSFAGRSAERSVRASVAKAAAASKKYAASLALAPAMRPWKHGTHGSGPKIRRTSACTGFKEGRFSSCL